MKQFIIKENDANQRMDKFITKSVPKLPQSMMYKALRTKRIKLNGKKCEISTRLSVGDLVEMYINDEFFEETEEKYQFKEAKNDIDIVYEDENIMLLNKPQGLVVHEDNEHTTDTLINRVLRYLYEKGEYNPDEELSFTPSLCNRIDRNTCGFVILAKNAEALREMNEIVKERMVTKKYLCIVHGTPKKNSDTLKDFLYKDSNKNTVTITKNPTPETKTVITKYNVIKSSGDYSLLEVELITGRTHQIRAHMAFIGHPLLGDTKYGFNRDNKGTGFKYQALCAYKLHFEPNENIHLLSYLNGKTFEIKNIDFADKFINGDLFPAKSRNYNSTVHKNKQRKNKR